MMMCVSQITVQQNLYGPIPNELGQLRSMTFLHLGKP
jgi:hypothetical protein